MTADEGVNEDTVQNADESETVADSMYRVVRFVEELVDDVSEEEEVNK